MKPTSRNKRELMIEMWEQLDCESVGARELEQIQDAIQAAYGEGAVDSPASIARVLADEGAVLRHPEIISCDVKWRESQQEKAFVKESPQFLNFPAVSKALLELAQQWHTANEYQQEKIREQVRDWAREVSLLSASKILNAEEMSIGREVQSWLAIWLQNPEMFNDWLSLRKRAPDFVKRFGDQGNTVR
jgi:hypothetical protein